MNLRILGIDYGDSRTGFAVSDELGITAQSLVTVSEKNALNIVRRAAALAHEHHVSEIVVGLPKNMNGTVGERGLKTQAFAESLRKEASLPVTLWDERLTTVSALNLLNEANVRGEKRKKAVDKIAAALILQNFLDCKSNIQKEC